MTLLKELEKIQPSIIAIDGQLASGKTTLANEICEKLNIKCISVDDYLEPGTGQYFSAIRFPKLIKHFNSQLKPIVIEGACLLKVLEKLDIFPDYMIYLDRTLPNYHESNDGLAHEVTEYTTKYYPVKKANFVKRKFDMTYQHDVDIAYLKSRTLFSALLAIGGIISIIIGAILLNSGLQGDDTAVFKLLGAEVSATGIGGVILSTSVVWAFLAYKSRPVYTHKKETKKSIGIDGSVEEWETESSTRAAVNSSFNSVDDVS